MRVAALEGMIRRAYPYATLSRDVLAATLDMLAGRYPSDEFADLRPRLTWDRATDRLTPRRDARQARPSSATIRCRRGSA